MVRGQRPAGLFWPLFLLRIRIDRLFGAFLASFLPLSFASVAEADLVQQESKVALYDHCYWRGRLVSYKKRIAAKAQYLPSLKGLGWWISKRRVPLRAVQLCWISLGASPFLL